MRSDWRRECGYPPENREGVVRMAENLWIRSWRGEKEKLGASISR